MKQARAGEDPAGLGFPRLLWFCPGGPAALFKARQRSAAERVRKTYGLQPAPSAPLLAPYFKARQRSAAERVRKANP